MSTITSEHTEHVSVTLATVISHTFQHYESFAKRNQTSFASNQQNNEGKSSTLPTSSIILIVVVGWVVLVGVIWILPANNVTAYRPALNAWKEAECVLHLFLLVYVLILGACCVSALESSPCGKVTQQVRNAAFLKTIYVQTVDHVGLHKDVLAVSGKG
eukprot:gene3434-6073_t